MPLSLETISNETLYCPVNKLCQNDFLKPTNPANKCSATFVSSSLSEGSLICKNVTSYSFSLSYFLLNQEKTVYAITPKKRPKIVIYTIIQNVLYTISLMDMGVLFNFFYKFFFVFIGYCCQSVEGFYNMCALFPGDFIYNIGRNIIGFFWNLCVRFLYFFYNL